MADQKMSVVKSIGVVSYAKIMALIYAIIGFIYGLLVALFILLAGSVTSLGIFPGGGLGIIGAIVFIRLGPIAGAISGFVFGVISAVIYNFAASKVGGIEVELK